jgi:hypothetical protein
MKLQDLRKLTIKQRLEIHFKLTSGQECVINQQGIAQVPGLHSPPPYNLEQELASASEFFVDYVAQLDKKGVPLRRKVSLAELTAMTGTPAGAAVADHDDD